MRTILLSAILVLVTLSAHGKPVPIDRPAVGLSAGLRSREQLVSSLWLNTGPVLASSGLALTYAAYNSPVLLPVTYATVDLLAWTRPLSFSPVPHAVKRIAVASGLRASLQTNRLTDGRLDGLSVGWHTQIRYDTVLFGELVPRLQAAGIFYGDGLWFEGESALGRLLWERLLVQAALKLTISASYYGLGAASATAVVLALELLL